MKKMLSIVLFLTLVLGAPQVYANDISNNDKQTLPILIVNNSYEDTRPSMAKFKSEMPPLVINKITKILNSKYNVKEIENTFNIHDIASTEKNDILDMFKETNYPAALLIEILPIQEGGLYSKDFHSIHVKVLDLKTQKYLYNGKLWRHNNYFPSAFSDMSIELDKIFKVAFNL